MIPFAAPVVAWAAKSALMQSPIGDAIRMVPPRVWKALLLVALVGLAIFLAWRWFDGKLDAAYDKGFSEGEEKAYARVEAKAKRMAAQATAISLNIRKVTDAKITRSDAAARDLIVRGPGKAAYSCPAVAAPGGHLAPGGTADAAVDRLPDPERSQLAVVPFADLVERARICDANRLEVEAWREDYAKRSKIR